VPVVGTSFGGMMACELAAHRPERVSKMVLLDPIGLVARGCAGRALHADAAGKAGGDAVQGS
jgi:pimeloyl-ACP methyl ester carboxylesterase